MSGSQTMTISKQDMQSILRQQRISPNQLATLLGLDEKTADDLQSSEKPGLSQETPLGDNGVRLLKQVVQPHNLSFVTALSQQDDFFFTSLVTGSSDYLYYGEEEGNITLKETKPQEAATLLGNVIGVADISKTGTSLTMSMDGLLTLACLLDRLKRQRLENLVLHVMTDEPVTPASLEEEFAIALETKDLRWTVPFMLETFDLETAPDVAKGQGELASLGITTRAKKQVTLTDPGRALAVALAGPRGMLGVKSLYYHNRSLVLDPLMFLRVSGYLYAIQGGSTVTFTSIDQEQFVEMMDTLLAPGEVPALMDEVISAPVFTKEAVESRAKDGVMEADAGEKKKPRPKFCRFCGTPLKARGKFCHSCGKEIGS